MQGTTIIIPIIVGLVLAACGNPTGLRGKTSSKPQAGASAVGAQRTPDPASGDTDAVAQVTDGTDPEATPGEQDAATRAPTEMTCAAYGAELRHRWLAYYLMSDVASGVAPESAVASLGKRIALMSGAGFGQADVDAIMETHKFTRDLSAAPDAEAAAAERERLIAGLGEQVILSDGPCGGGFGLGGGIQETTYAKGKGALDEAFEKALAEAEAQAKELADAKSKLAEIAVERARYEASVLPVPRAVVVHHGSHFMADYGANMVIPVQGSGPGWLIGITVSIGCEDWRPLKIFDKYECRLTHNGATVRTWDKNNCVYYNEQAVPGTWCSTCDPLASAFPAGTNLSGKRTQICIDVR